MTESGKEPEDDGEGTGKGKIAVAGNFGKLGKVVCAADRAAKVKKIFVEGLNFGFCQYLLRV